MKGGEPLTMREASFISSLMGHAQHIDAAIDAATVRFTMHIDGKLYHSLVPFLSRPQVRAAVLRRFLPSEVERPGLPRVHLC